MNSAVAIIIKNLVLIVIVILTILSYWSHVLNVHQLQVTQWSLGVLYILFTYIEFSNPAYRASLPAERFAYYPGSFFMFRIIKIALFLMFGILLLFVPSVIWILYPICFIIAISEIMVGVIKYVRRLSFVSVGENYVMIARESIEKIFASELENVEYRHDILYFVKKDRKTSVVKVFSVKEHDEFLSKIKSWINKNNVRISAESLERLGKF
jgi:hypothetical protein